MNKVLVFGLLAAAAAPALAQPKPVSRAEFMKQVDQQWAATDTNHDGVVSLTEIAADQQHALGLAKAAVLQQMRNRFNQLDTNKDGKLSFEEFAAAAPSVTPNQTPQQILQQLDTNHDGKISEAEFRAAQSAKFDRLDTNHDGIVSPAEMQAAGQIQAAPGKK